MVSETPTRRFRNPESIESERVTRAMLSGFLSRRGYAVESDERIRNGQTIVATDPDGEQLALRVRICWRRDRRSQESSLARTFSAAQLLANIGKDDWLVSLRKKIDRERSQGITHLLIVQNDDEHIVYAALVPLSDVLPIWIAQRDTSARLIAQGRLGRRKKNHAMNGVSPTLWLQDDRAPEVARELWNYPGVLDIARLKPASEASVSLSDEEANRAGFEDDTRYTPTDGDQRQEVERQIRERRGQQHFRDMLRERHGDSCLVTGCTILAVLEAAHIKPYRGENDNHPENGLLLRSDIHTLFDLDLLGIEPDRLQVELHPSLTQEYGNLAGTTLGCAPDRRPSHKALALRYAEFQRRLDRFTSR
uniref:HNH nuclease domain-containing protein n=1 Tax=mine drainage metagenome TaxID=410659 RepID=E6PXI8_9ZZZZ